MSEMNEMFDHILKSVETTRRCLEVLFDAINFDYDEAYQNYADAINKNAKKLSTHERQQAVLNHVLKDGENDIQKEEE